MHRIKWIDVAKGWGIILLIYGHIADDYFAKWLYTFHIPLFFFLSGFLFNPNKSFSHLIWSKAKSLLLPYLTLGIPLLLINLLYGYKLLYLLKLFIIQERMFPLWFITALFLQIILCYIIICKVKKKWRIITIFFLSLIGIGYWRLGGTALPWNFDISLVTLPFFYGGYYIKSNYHFLENVLEGGKTKYFLLCAGANLFGFIINLHLHYQNIDLFTNNFGFEPLSYFTAFWGIFATIVFSSSIHSKILSFIGRNSLVFFAWQQDIAIILANKLLSQFSFVIKTTYIKNIIILVISIIILSIIVEIINRTRLRRLIGK